MSTVSPDRPVAYVLGTFPQASQTFIAREIRGLREQGRAPVVFALRRRPADSLEPVDREWYREVRFVPFALSPTVLGANLHWIVREPARYIRALARVVGLPHRPRVMTLRAVALVFAAAWIARQVEREGGCRHVHAHFALAQTEVAMAVASLLGCSMSFTAHARDIYATPSALEEKIRAAAFVVTCTAYNADYLRRLCPDMPPSHVNLVHHGVDVEVDDTKSDESAGNERPALILAAGRLIEKKGFDTLIDACAQLRARGITFECRIYGTGPLRNELQRRVESRGVADAVTLPGWSPAQALRASMHRAAVFAMPSRVTSAGDRDGIPNVVLEAMAAGLPVVATDVSGIPEVVRDGRTGFLVPPDAPAALADALQRALTDARTAAQVAAAARSMIAEEFTVAVSSARLAALFETAIR